MGKPMTNGEIMAVYGGEARKKCRRFWEKEIRILMHDFCMPEEKITKVIEDTRAMRVCGDNNASMYQKAWRRFKEVLNSS